MAFTLTGDVRTFVEKLKFQTEGNSVDDIAELMEKKLIVTLGAGIVLKSGYANAEDSWFYYRKAVRTILDEFNEISIINTEKVYRSVKGIYMARWNLAFRAFEEIEYINRWAGYDDKPDVTSNELLGFVEALKAIVSEGEDETPNEPSE